MAGLRRRIPLIGASLAYVQDPLTFMQELYERDGPVAEVSMLGIPWTFLLGPDACGVAFRNADKAFANGPGWGLLVGPFFDRGLMLLDFAEHHQHRRILQEAFTRDRLAGYTQALVPAIDAAVGQWVPGPEFKVYPALKALTLDLATRIFIGRAAGSPALNRAFVDCVQAAGGYVRAPLPGTRWGRAAQGRRLLVRELGDQVPLARAGDGDDLFSALCHVSDETGAALSDRDVVNHMIFLLMAAHDTSTITVTAAMRYLGQHPQWQERCRDEALRTDDPEQMAMVGLVVQECLRLSPPVPILARRTVRPTEVLGRSLPAGRQVAVGVQLTHYLPELWPDPYTFDPERFGPDRREDRSHRYAWEPFGGGVHKCLGMAFAQIEVNAVLAAILRRFSWQVDPGYRPRMVNNSLPYPADGQPVALASV